MTETNLAIADWRLAPDPGDVGVTAGWFRAVPVDAVPAPVPGVIQQVFPEALGIGWYWSSVDLIPVPEDHRLVLRFGAVDYIAQVWVDGIPVGEHEGVDTPFDVDITALAGRGPVAIAVRVVHGTETGIGGLLLAETPHRNKRSVNYHPGWLHNVGGLLGPVACLVVPAVRVIDLVGRPAIDTGVVAVEVAVQHDGQRTVSGRLEVAIGPDRAGTVEDRLVADLEWSPGTNERSLTLVIPTPSRWDIDDPFLYRVTARLTASTGAGEPLVHERAVRVGFRDFGVVNGFFQLNGRRIYVRSSHTGNHFPISQAVPPTPDLLRRDLINAKASGFNMIRFYSGLALPEQLAACDELGLLVYEEPMVAWLLRDSPAMTRRFDDAIAAMVRRDRNHPSVVVWGLLTEGPDGPVFRHAMTVLPWLRKLDPTRLVILNSGRMDAKPAIGSVSNPGGTTWEHTWGCEAPDAPGRDLPPDPVTGWMTNAAWINGDLSLAGAIDGNGDTHTYPIVPHTDTAIDFLRTLGHGTKPHMLSEYGIGSLMNVIGETRRYEQFGAREDLLDAALIRSMADRFEADLERYGLADLYPFPEDVLLEAQRAHGRYRALGFDIVRSNPNIPGFNVTGLLDHALTGEGFWTFWRQWKPGIVDVLTDGWAPLRWCLFSRPRHVHAGRDLRLEAVLANDDALPPGTYDARFRLSGPAGLAWQATASIVVPPGPDGPLALAALDVVIPAPTSAGSYTYGAELARGGRPAGGRLRIEVSAPVTLDGAGITVASYGLDPTVDAWLVGHGVRVMPFDASGTDPRMVLVGDPGPDADPRDHARIRDIVVGGGVAIYLTPDGLQRGDDSLGWLPDLSEARCERFYDWVYHREWVGGRHPMMEGLQGSGVLDWDAWGPLLSTRMFTGLPADTDVAAAAFAVGYSAPGGYASGVVAGSLEVGAGRIALNAFDILPNLDRHPVADRLLVNLIRWAEQ